MPAGSGRVLSSLAVCARAAITKSGSIREPRGVTPRAVLWPTAAAPPRAVPPPPLRLVLQVLQRPTPRSVVPSSSSARAVANPRRPPPVLLLAVPPPAWPRLVRPPSVTLRAVPPPPPRLRAVPASENPFSPRAEGNMPLHSSPSPAGLAAPPGSMPSKPSRGEMSSRSPSLAGSSPCPSACCRAAFSARERSAASQAYRRRRSTARSASTPRAPAKTHTQTGISKLIGGGGPGGASGGLGGGLGSGGGIGGKAGDGSGTCKQLDVAPKMVHHTEAF